MNRRVLLSVLLLSSACVDNRASIEIDGRAAPADVTTCKFTPGGENVLGPGLLDVGSSMSPSYSLVIYVKNNLANPATSAPVVVGQIPTLVASAKAWTADAARVRLNPSGFVDPYGPNPTLLDFQAENVVPLDGQTVQPGGGQATQHVEAVSGALGALLTGKVSPGELKRVVLGITLQGHTGDSAYLDTGEWYFPIDLCNGCLAAPTSCPTGEVLKATNCFGPDQDSAPACSAP